MDDLLAFIGGLWATSRDRKRIVWHTVVMGMLLQFAIALFVLRTSFGFGLFSSVSGFFTQLQAFSTKGAAFLLSEDVMKKPWMIVTLFPAIIFFVALIQMVSGRVAGQGSG